MEDRIDGEEDVEVDLEGYMQAEQESERGRYKRVGKETGRSFS